MSYYPDRDFIPSPRNLWFDSVLTEDYEPGHADVAILVKTSGTVTPNLVSSLCEDGLHRPAFDVDLPFTPENILRLVGTCALLGINGIIVYPSTNHCHVYAIDPPLEFDEYMTLLKQLVTLNLVEIGYLGASMARGHTRLRLPGVRKPPAQNREVSLY